MPDGGPTRGRTGAYLVAALATVALGLLSRSVRTGCWLLDKSLGDALYAALIYFGLSALFPRWSPRARALWAALFCSAIEAFKLTGLPQAWVSSRLSRLVFGTTPSLHNLLCYLAGIAAASLLDRAWEGRRPARSSGREG